MRMGCASGVCREERLSWRMSWMVICLDMVGRKSVTVGRADDDGDLSKGELLFSSSKHHCKSFFARKQNESNTVLPTGNLGKTLLPCHAAICDLCRMTMPATPIDQSIHAVDQFISEKPSHYEPAYWKVQGKKIVRLLDIKYRPTSSSFQHTYQS